MFKKVLLMSVIFLFLFLGIAVFLGMTGEPLVDAAAQLEQAQVYVESGDYEQAEAIYNSIIQDYPATDNALKAQKGLVILYIAWDKQPEADGAFDELLAGFSEHKDIAEAVSDIAYNYGELQQYEKARELYQYVIENWPDSGEVMWSQAGLVMSNIALGDDPNADAAIEKLLIDFSNHNDIAEALGDIAQSYWDVESYQKARQLHQHVIDNWPDSDDVMWSQAGLAMSNIELADDPNAQAAIEKLLTEFSDNNDIAQVLYNIADHYGVLQQYEKARQLFQYVIDNWPNSEGAILSQIGVAMTNVVLADDPNVQAATDSLIADFNSHPDLQAVLYDIAGGYEDLYKYEEAKSIYQQIIQQFPEGGKAQLGIHKCQILIFIDNGNDTAAQTAVDTLIVDFNEHPDLPDAISNIEEAYCVRIMAAETWVRENYLHPVEIWQKVITKFPDFFHNDPDLYYFIACCYYQLGEYENAIEYYIIVIDNWPDYKYTWGAQRLIDTCFERLTNVGK